MKGGGSGGGPPPPGIASRCISALLKTSFISKCISYTLKQIAENLKHEQSSLICFWLTMSSPKHQGISMNGGGSGGGPPPPGIAKRCISLLFETSFLVQFLSFTF